MMDPAKYTIPTMYGDTDENNDVDVSDTVLLACYLVEDSGAKITSQGIASADVNLSGNPDTDDVIMIVKYAANLGELPKA